VTGSEIGWTYSLPPCPAVDCKDGLRLLEASVRSGDSSRLVQEARLLGVFNGLSRLWLVFTTLSSRACSSSEASGCTTVSSSSQQRKDEVGSSSIFSTSFITSRSSAIISSSIARLVMGEGSSTLLMGPATETVVIKPSTDSTCGDSKRTFAGRTKRSSSPRASWTAIVPVMSHSRITVPFSPEHLPLNISTRVPILRTPAPVSGGNWKADLSDGACSI